MAVSDDQQTFITWLLTPKSERRPATQGELAAMLGESPERLTAWKKDPEFLHAWNTEYLATISSPERKAKIMSTLISTATDQDDPKHVQAAKTYFEIEGSLRPTTQVELEVKKPLSELSDEQLAALTSTVVTDELAKRREAS